MRWDREAVPNLEDAAALPATAAAADAGVVAEAVAALAGDDLESLRFIPTMGSLLASSFEREIETGPDTTDEQALLDGVRTVLDGAGATTEELQLEMSTLRAVGGEIGEEPTAHDVAKTIKIGRKVLGLYVSLDAGTASFSMDGRFIGMRFQWRRVDYANSVLVAPGIETEEDVMAAAAQSLADRGVELRPTVYAIDVGAYYVPKAPVDPESDLWTLDLVGYAHLRNSNGNGMGGEGEIPSYELYLDGRGPLLPDED